MFKGITDYFSGIEFDLWDKFVEMWTDSTERTWFLAGVAVFAVILAGIIAFSIRRRRIKKSAEKSMSSAESVSSAESAFNSVQHGGHRTGVRALSYGALCISLSFILSYVKLFSMPQCGSVTLLAMLPLALYAYWFGPAYGIAAGVIYGILQMFQENYIVHWFQPFLDYIFAFGSFGLVGFFRPSHRDTSRSVSPEFAEQKAFPRLIIGILVAGTCRLICSTLSGAIFFAEYAWEGWNVWLYSFVYNFLSIGIDVILCAIVTALPPVRKTVFRLRRTVFASGKN